MKIYALIVICFVLATAQNFEKALTSLYDIKKQNRIDQTQDDSEMIKFEAKCREDLESIADYKTSAEDSLSYSRRSHNNTSRDSERLQEEIEALGQNLNAAQEMLNTLMGLRCQETTIFLQNLKDSKEALDLIQYMQIDVEKFYGNKNSEFVKISAKINELVGKEFSNSQLQTSTLEDIKELKGIVYRNIENLEKKELRSARDFVQWQIMARKQNERYQKELEEKKGVQFKVNSSGESAKKRVDSAQDAFNHAEMLYGSEKERCEERRNKYLSMKAVRESDLQLIEEAISIFQKQIRQDKELSNTLQKE